jgi:hypothetical protein
MGLKICKSALHIHQETQKLIIREKILELPQQGEKPYITKFTK